MTVLNERKKSIVVRTALIVLVLAVPFVFAIARNNTLLNRFASNLFEYPLPPDTVEVDRHREIFVRGNGNHCDFKVTRSMRTRLDREALENYYHNVELPTVRPTSEWHPTGTVPVELGFRGNGNSGETNFHLSILDGGYSPGFDPRCH